MLLVAFSYVTRPVPKATLDRFFARVHTPVQPTPEADAAAVEASYANPRQASTRDKLFPGTELGDHEAGDERLSSGSSGPAASSASILVLLWVMVTVQ